MTIDTKRLRELCDEWRVNAPHETVEEANDLLCAVPELLDEVERLRRDLNNARANARILAHSYLADSRPPQRAVDEALAYPARPETK